MSMQIDKRPSMGRFPDESGIPRWRRSVGEPWWKVKGFPGVGIVFIAPFSRCIFHRSLKL